MKIPYLWCLSENRNERKMSQRDDITGRKAMNGYRSSKSNNKTKHRFHLNLQKRRFYIPEEDRWITLKVSAKTLKTINKKGITAVLKDAKKKGTLLKHV
jgi:large subunit ribosomal protein L28